MIPQLSFEKLKALEEAAELLKRIRRLRTWPMREDAKPTLSPGIAGLRPRAERPKETTYKCVVWSGDAGSISFQIKNMEMLGNIEGELLKRVLQPIFLAHAELILDEAEAALEALIKSTAAEAAGEAGAILEVGKETELVTTENAGSAEI